MTLIITISLVFLVADQSGSGEIITIFQNPYLYTISNQEEQQHYHSIWASRLQREARGFYYKLFEMTSSLSHVSMPLNGGSMAQIPLKWRV